MNTYMYWRNVLKNRVVISELWSLRINPSDLYNIERVPEDKPDTGGGHTYIQVPKGQVDNLLKFLHSDYPINGQALRVQVGNQKEPNAELEELEFWSKSNGRMRIAQQNRNSQNRLSAWSSASGFPKLDPFQGTEVASELLNNIGLLHLYLIRTSDKAVWAGFTTGQPSVTQLEQPFAKLLWGNTRGGYWSLKENN